MDEQGARSCCAALLVVRRSHKSRQEVAARASAPPVRSRKAGGRILVMRRDATGPTGLFIFLLALFAAAVAQGCGSTRDIATDHVVLITIDTLRADHLDCYGYYRETAPWLCDKAEEGVLFTRAFASSSHTGPSHASLFTSLQPVQHKVRENGEQLDGAVLTMAEMYRDLGYKTAAFTSVRFLETVSEGFDFVDTKSGGQRYYRTADNTVGAALAWLEEQDPQERLFLWVHLYDVHDSKFFRNGNRKFLAKLEAESSISGSELVDRLIAERQVPVGYFGRGFLRSILEKEPIPEATQALLSDPDLPADTFGRTLMAHLINQYDAQIQWVDSQLERLYQSMESSGWNQDVLWIVTSDHGEGLGSHEFYGHGKHIYQEQLHVPLILFAPGDGFAPARVDRLVSHVDVFPTLAEMAGGSLEEQPAEVMGSSLVPLITGSGSFAPTTSYAQRRDARASWEQGEIVALQSDRYKYIYHFAGDDEFYDLQSDPYELDNLLIGNVGADAEVLKDQLLALFAGMVENSASIGSGAVDPALLEELRALGYIR